MTDVNVSNDDDQEDDVPSEDEVEGTKSFDLHSLGIDPSTPLVDMLKIYRDQVTIVQNYATAQKKGSSDPSDVSNVIKTNLKNTLASKDEAVAAKVSGLRELGAKFTSAVFSRDEATSTLLSSSVLLQELENLVSLMEDEVAYHLNKAIQDEKNRLGIKSTPSETATNAKLACNKLRLLIENRVNYYQVVEELDQIPTGLIKPVVPGKKGGFNTDLFPRKPKWTPESVTSTSNTFHLTFRFKVTDSDEWVTYGKGTLAEVAHNVVSSGAYRVTGKDIERMLRDAKLGIGASDWTLSFKTGTLKATKAS